MQGATHNRLTVMSVAASTRAATTKSGPCLIGSLSTPINTRRHPNVEPIPDPAGHPWLADGLAEFNAGRHWHAHEAWEHLWLGLEGDDKMFVQGLIMAAAMLHQHGRRITRGVLNHWENVVSRLSPHVPKKWGLDVAGFLGQLAPYAIDAESGAYALDAAHVQVHGERL
jgi:hypothetical protein